MRRWIALGTVLVLLIAAGAVAWRYLPHPALPGAGAPTQTASRPAEGPGTAPGAPPAAAGAAHETLPAGFAYLRVVTDTSKDKPAACLRFSRPLDPRPEAHYGDYVKLTPPADIAFRVEDNALCLDGLRFGKLFKVAIAAGLPARDGTRLPKAASDEIDFGERPARVGFSETGFILSREGTAGVMVDTVNVQKVAIEVLRVGDRILPGMVSSLKTKESGSRWNLETMVEQTARPVWSGTMAVDGAPNATVHTSFPLTQAVPDRQPGAYLVVAADAAHLAPRTKDERFLWQRSEDEYQFAAQWVIVTDVALSTVTAADGLHVFARSLATAKPIQGVGIDLLARDQQVLGHAETGGDGQALFAPGLLRGEGAAQAAAVFAYGSGGDFALQDLTQPAFDLSDRGVGGREVTGPIDAFVYTDRGIYRPGETVHAVALMRDRVGNAIADAPLTLVLRRPNGVEYRRTTIAAQPGGGFRLSLDLPDTASRGAWSVEAVDADDNAVGRASFEVQDFVPQRLKVTARTAAKVLRPGDKIAVDVDGLFLYGAPAADLGAEAHLSVAPDPAPFPQSAQGYRFGIADTRFSPTEADLDIGQTDAQGHAQATGTLEKPKAENLPLKATITVGIQEPGGRVTDDTVELPIRMSGLSIGVRPRFKDNRVGENEPAQFEIIALDEDGKPVVAPLHWTLIQQEFHYDWVQVDGRWTYHVSTTDKPLRSGEVQVAADKPAVIGDPVDWGSYRLLVEDPAGGAATAVPFEAGWLETDETADTPDKVEVTVEKERYPVGDTARLRIVPPFAGRVQLIVARDKVFETRELDVPREGATVEVPVAADWGSGAYVLASLYRPADGGRGHLPVRAVGLAWVAVDPGPRQLGIALDPPRLMIPRQTVQVPVKVTGGTAGEPVYLTLAAVDEGILQLTRFQSPDPVGFYFGKRRLAAEMRDDYGRLLDGTAAPGTLRSGGDQTSPKSLPVVPTRSVALFSGIVTLAGDGTASIPLEVPDFEGALRLMAVAFSRSAVGKGELMMTVRDKVVADVSLPRFLAPGDQARLTLLLDNTDGAAGSYKVGLAGAGAVSVTPDKPLDFTLAKGERKIATVPVAGLDEGIGKVALTLTGPGGYKVARDWSISVRGAHFPITLATTALQPSGQSFTVDPKTIDAFVPGSLTVSLSYSRLAGIDVPGLLQSLWRYPYGCTEQLISTAYPLIYYDDAALSGQAAKDKGLHARVQAAIDRIVDRQNGDGSFGLWRAGDDFGSEWLSLYALDFLMHAREAGYQVGDATLEKSFGFAAETVQRGSGGVEHGRGSHPFEDEAYAQWLLAQAKRADLGRLRMMHDALQRRAGQVAWNPDDKVGAEPLALAELSGALATLGDRARAADSMREAVFAATRPHETAWWVAWSYWSSLRDAAGILAVAAQTDQLDAVRPVLPQLQKMSQTPDLLTTQEKAWLLEAAHAVSSGEGDVALKVGGKPFQGKQGQAALLPTAAEIAGGYTVENASGRDLYRSLVVHGSPRTAPPVLQQGVTLVKTTLGLDGKPLDPAHLPQNRRFIVLLKGKTHDDALHHLILVDPLPAGWEIEAVLAPDSAPDFLGPLSNTVLREGRDDRLLAAVDAGAPAWSERAEEEEEEPSNDQADSKAAAHRAAREEQAKGGFAVAYVVRAVTPGSFVLPEAVVEDMYRPGVTARTAAGTATVEAP